MNRTFTNKINPSSSTSSKKKNWTYEYPLNIAEFQGIPQVMQMPIHVNQPLITIMSITPSQTKGILATKMMWHYPIIYNNF